MSITKFYDFIGNEITIGSYCAYPGGGNAKCEYGMILYKIIGFDEEKGKVKAIRLFVEFGQGKNRDQFHPSNQKNAIYSTITFSEDTEFERTVKCATRHVVSTIENTNKLAVVYPAECIKSMFDKIIAMDETVFNDIPAEAISNWLHGSSSVEHSFLKWRLNNETH